MIYYSKHIQCMDVIETKDTELMNRQAIKRYGLTRIHRRSFLGNLNRC